MYHKTEQEIMKSWVSTLDKPAVSICCPTYNHELYIAEAIEGFLMQETNFPFEVLIRDDFSTDRTALIVKEYANKYPTLIKPVYEKENTFSKGVKPMSQLYKIALGEYIALCEGDDYWTDALKLQKQVDFLESNPEYVMCWTRFNTLEQKTEKLELDKNSKYFLTKNGIDFTFEIFAKGWHIGVQTLLYNRKSIIGNNNFNNEFYRDIFLISDLLSIGKGFCLNDLTAVYRVHSAGIYSGTNKLEKAEKGAMIYKEIYRTYSDNEYLKIKFKIFNAHYINCLIKNNLYNEAFSILNDRVKLLISLDTHKNNFLSNKKEKLIQLKLYLKIKIKQLIMLFSNYNKS